MAMRESVFREMAFQAFLRNSTEGATAPESLRLMDRIVVGTLESGRESRPTEGVNDGWDHKVETLS